MRALRWIPLVLVAVLPGLESCVGDDPSTAAGDDTSGLDGGSDSTTTIPDASPNDANASTDSGADAGHVDPCKGEVTGCPGVTDPTHLKVWLRGDTGLDCGSGRVTTWHDLTGNGHDATAAAYSDGGLAIAPQCGVDSIKGHSVVSFTHPTESSAPYLAETMTLDLGFMANASFTVFIVVKPSFSTFSSLGLLSADRSANSIVACAGGTINGYNNGTLAFIISAHPDGGSFVESYDHNATCPVYSAPGLNPSNPTYAVGYVFDAVHGHTLYFGTDPTFTGDAGPVDLEAVSDVGMRPGNLGRDSNGALSLTDLRYQGDIAEVVIYDVALSTEISALNSYFYTRWQAP